MGAEVFYHRARGNTPEEALAAAADEAAYEHGHDGYTGTIAEKDSFIEIPLPTAQELISLGIVPDEKEYANAACLLTERYAEHLIGKNDPRICDKWGDAGCLKVGPGDYLFFGWASS